MGRSIFHDIIAFLLVMLLAAGGGLTAASALAKAEEPDTVSSPAASAETAQDDVEEEELTEEESLFPLKFLESLRVECFADSIRDSVAKIMPTSFLGLMEPEDAQFFSSLLGMNVKNLQLMSDYDGFVLAGELPAAGNGLQKLGTSDLSLAELMRMVGLAPELFPEEMREILLDVSPAGVPGVYQIKDDNIAIAIAAVGNVLIIGNKAQRVAAARDSIAKNGKLFAVNAGEQIWMKTSMELPGGEDGKKPIQNTQWFSLKAIPEGWAYTAGNNSDTWNPEIASLPALPLAKTAVYGSSRPSFLLMISGKYIQAIMKNMALFSPQDIAAMFADVPSEAYALDTALLTMGTSEGNAMGMNFPSGLALSVTGEKSALASLQNRIKSWFKEGQWKDVFVSDWASVQEFIPPQGEDGDGILVPFVMASRNNTLLMQQVAPDAVSGREQNVLDLMHSYGLGTSLPFPAEKVSALSVLDVDELWREISEFLAPGSPARALAGLDEGMAPEVLTAFERLRTLTPPLHAFITWSAPEGTSAQGYILTSHDDSSEFSKTLVEMLRTLLYTEPEEEEESGAES